MKNWIGTVVLVGISAAAGMFFSQIWEQVFGQAVGFSVEVPQVVVRPPAEMPKWCVDITDLPPQAGRPGIRAITVVDTETKKFLFYHHNVIDGSLWLISTRNIAPDLMLDEHNAQSPLPSEIMREMQRLEQMKQNR